MQPLKAVAAACCTTVQSISRRPIASSWRTQGAALALAQLTENNILAFRVVDSPGAMSVPAYCGREPSE